jgi:hypothetical protein
LVAGSKDNDIYVIKLLDFSVAQNVFDLNALGAEVSRYCSRFFGNIAFGSAVEQLGKVLLGNHVHLRAHGA